MTTAARTPTVVEPSTPWVNPLIGDPAEPPAGEPTEAAP